MATELKKTDVVIIGLGALGVGLAFPYILVTFVPRLAARLPGILPPLEPAEALEFGTTQSVPGWLPSGASASAPLSIAASSSAPGIIGCASIGSPSTGVLPVCHNTSMGDPTRCSRSPPRGSRAPTSPGSGTFRTWSSASPPSAPRVPTCGFSRPATSAPAMRSRWSGVPSTR